MHVWNMVICTEHSWHSRNIPLNELTRYPSLNWQTIRTVPTNGQFYIKTSKLWYNTRPAHVGLKILHMKILIPGHPQVQWWRPKFYFDNQWFRAMPGTSPLSGVWGLLTLFPHFRYFSDCFWLFSPLGKNTGYNAHIWHCEKNTAYHVHIWQLLTLSCGDTRQIWKWLK